MNVTGNAALGFGLAVLLGVGAVSGCSSDDDAPEVALAPATSSSPVGSETFLTCEDYGKTHTVVSHGDMEPNIEAGTYTIRDDQGSYLIRFDDAECRSAYPLVEKVLAGAEKDHRSYAKNECRSLISGLKAYEALDPELLTDPGATQMSDRGIEVKVAAQIHHAHVTCGIVGVEVPWPDPGPVAP